MTPQERETLLRKLSARALQAAETPRTVNWTGYAGGCQTLEPLTTEAKIAVVRQSYDPLLTVLLECQEVLDGIIGTEGPLPKIHKDHIVKGTAALTKVDQILEQVKA